MTERPRAQEGAGGALPAHRAGSADTDGNGAVWQVEKRDYTDLPDAGSRHAQGMDGFEPIYTDIVDYIIRCTHRIWDEKNIGLIYTHYTHNAVVSFLARRQLFARGGGACDSAAHRGIPGAARARQPGDLERQRPGRLLHLAPDHQRRPLHRARVPTACRPARRSTRGPSRIAWCSATASIGNGWCATIWASSCISASIRTRWRRRWRPSRRRAA